MHQGEIDHQEQPQGTVHCSFGSRFVLCAHQTHQVLRIGRKTEAPAPECRETDHGREPPAEELQHLARLRRRSHARMGGAGDAACCAVERGKASGAADQGTAQEQETDSQKDEVEHIGPQH